jgi:hypothetical protein
MLASRFPLVQEVFSTGRTEKSQPGARENLEYQGGNMNRAALLRFAVGFATIGLAALISGIPGEVLADNDETLALDVAIDCRTWRFNQGIAFSDFGRGDSFIANGKLFRAGTLETGTSGNDPNAPGSVGTFIEHGIMAATFAEISAGKRPAFAGTWYNLLNDGRGIIAEGPHPDSGPMVVVGGTGGFRGARGDVSVSIIGTNITGCPNMRVTFNLIKK